MRKLHEGISNVLNRIRSIEQKFSVQPANQTAFQNLFELEIDKEKNNIKPTTVSTKKHAVSADGNINNMIEQSAHKYGVDPKLVNAVARTESNYSTNAVSEAGAVGIMQLMPETAASLGVNDIYNPRDNIEGGTKYIKQLLNTFDGDVPKAVAAYNAGPQAVKTYNGIPPYSETKNYVKKVLDLYS